MPGARSDTVAKETMNPAQLELLTEYLQRIEAQLDRVEKNLRAVTELVERVAGQPGPKRDAFRNSARYINQAPLQDNSATAAD